MSILKAGAISLIGVLALSLTGCGTKQNALATIPSTTQQACPLSSGRHVMYCPPPGGTDPDMVKVSTTWNSTYNSGTAQPTDATGATMANVSSTYYATETVSTVQGGSINVTNLHTVNPTTLQTGMNQLPNGTLYIDGTTQIVTANVTGADGTQYTITGTPTDTGFSIHLQASNGQSWTRNVDAPPGTYTMSTRTKMSGCSSAGRAIDYFGGVAGVAAGVGLVAGLTGAEPVAIVAGGVGILSGSIAGGAMLYRFFARCL